ncbi:MAG TPA: HD domain-containing protein [candidate division Zixibacteria bacterium]|jgi:3'-5' exoribonuclease
MTAIRDLVSGDSVDGFFALRKLERREHSGGERLTLELGDATGRIDAVMWDGYETVVDGLTVGGVVKIRGTVGTFRERPQIRVDRMRLARDGEVNPAEFLPVSSINAEDLARGLDTAIAGLTDTHLRALMTAIFGDDSVRRAYLAAPAGKLWHHNTVGGLAEHSLNLVRLCHYACEMYPELNRDLLTCGALLHDIGKIEQYAVSSYIDYSDEGRLVGHINSGDFRVAQAIRSIDGFSADTERLLRHLIVSHQGLLEQGSPVVPQTMEAFVLYSADELDSKMGALRRVREKTPEGGWSEYINLIGRYVYFGPPRQGSGGDKD